MRKNFVKLISAGLTLTLTLSTGTVAFGADLMSSILPAAGTARVLNEGVSVTAVQAEKIKSDRGIETKSEKASAEKANPDSVLSKAGDSIIISSKTTTSSDTTSSSSMKMIEEPTVTTSDGSEPELITVGAGSTAGAGAEEEDGTSDTAEAVLTSIEGTGEAVNLVDVITSSRKSDESTEDIEDFTNLVIANVDGYVNVRDAASEEGNVVGKLYDKSVGDLIEEEDGWYKISSGSVTGYVKAEYCVTGEDAQAMAKEVGIRMAVVNTTTLYVRKEPSKEAEVIGMVPVEDELQVLAEMDGWIKVSVEEGDGFVSSEYVRLYTDFVRAESKAEEEARLAREEQAREAARKAAEAAGKKNSSSKSNGNSSGGGSGVTYAASGSGQGTAVANYALQFVGNPYVYGGTSLTNGADCSGFVMSVYRNFGVSLPHSSGADRSVGYGVSGGIANAQAGDIVCYSGHVGIYIGNGQIVHASTAKTGIKVSPVSYRSVLAVRRIF